MSDKLDKIKVQDGIPIPPAMRATAPSRRKYPFHDLEIGQFFFVPNREKNNIGPRSNAVAKQLNRSFKTRLLYMEKSTGAWEPCAPAAEGAVLGIGVWRVE